MVGLSHVLGVVLSLVAALGVASAYLLIRKGTDTGSVYDAVFVVIGVEVALLTIPVAIIYYPEYGFTRASVFWFVAAGVVGTVLGQLFMYSSVSTIGASRSAPITNSWVVVSTVLGVLLLGERVSLVHAVGVVLVVGGVAVIAWETSQENPDDLARRELLVGLSFPLGAAAAYGLEPILAKFGLLEGTPSPVGLVLKTVAAFTGFTIYLRWRNLLPDPGLLRSPDGRWYLLAGVATTVFLVGYYGALEVAPVSIVAPVVVTNTLFVVLLSALFVPDRLERVTGTLAGAATVVVLGVVLITVFG